MLGKNVVNSGSCPRERVREERAPRCSRGHSRFWLPHCREARASLHVHVHLHLHPHRYLQRAVRLSHGTELSGIYCFKYDILSDMRTCGLVERQFGCEILTPRQDSDEIRRILCDSLRPLRRHMTRAPLPARPGNSEMPFCGE